MTTEDDEARAKIILNTLDKGFGRVAREMFVELQIREVRADERAACEREIMVEIRAQVASIQKVAGDAGHGGDTIRETLALGAAGALGRTIDRIESGAYRTKGPK